MLEQLTIRNTYYIEIYRRNLDVTNRPSQPDGPFSAFESIIFRRIEYKWAILNSELLNYQRVHPTTYLTLITNKRF